MQTKLFSFNVNEFLRIIGLWCNGNTTVFGAVFQGSSPCRPTKSLSEMKGFFVFINLGFRNKKNLSF